jgi:outer membrane lipoprotein SlyB
MENNTSKRIHPLVAGAAIAVMLVSLTGVAAITGLIPDSHSNGTPSGSNAAVAAAEPKAEIAALAPNGKSAPADDQNTAPRTAQAPQSQPRASHSASQAKVAQAPAVCHSCGRVESVQAVQQAAPASGVGMVAGAVLGGVLGNQVGGGNGRKIATVAGAVGGGYAGNEIEKHTRGTTTYHVKVRMEDGEVRSFPYEQQPGWNAGDRVRVVDGQLTARA